MHTEKAGFGYAVKYASQFILHVINREWGESCLNTTEISLEGDEGNKYLLLAVK